jgi:alpha/beta superfamily hydrolase
MGVSADPVPVRTDIHLRRRAEDIVLHTGDGLDLVGELSLPADRDPVASLVCFHPLPTQGGFMDSHLIRKAAYRLPELAGLAVLRFNSRGTASPRGTSQGHFDEARGERFDMAAAMAFAAERGLPDVWMFGWSFGADLIVKYGRQFPSRGAILVSPPLRWATPAEVAAWKDDDRPLHVLVPGNDLFLPPAAAGPAFAPDPRAQLEFFDDCVHLWVGERQTRLVLNRVVALLNPAAAPLPTEVSADRVAD